MSESSRGLLVLASLFLLAAGCTVGSGEDSRESALTQRERDSVLAESPIPGARAVKAVLTAADSANARAERMNSRAK